MFTILVGEDNPLGIERNYYRFGLAGWKAVCNDDFVEDFDVGIVVKTSGTHPDPAREVGPRQQDVGRYSDKQDPSRVGCQPRLVHFPIKHALYYKGVPELCAAIRAVWQVDKMVVFQDNKGGFRATHRIMIIWGDC